jgi:hypothetical protein
VRTSSMPLGHHSLTILIINLGATLKAALHHSLTILIINLGATLKAALAELDAVSPAVQRSVQGNSLAAAFDNPSDLPPLLAGKRAFSQIGRCACGTVHGFEPNIHSSVVLRFTIVLGLKPSRTFVSIACLSGGHSHVGTHHTCYCTT